MITGCCASSPSRKKPIQISPWFTLIGFLNPALPDPLLVGNITVAQGKSSSDNSVVF